MNPVAVYKVLLVDDDEVTNMIHTRLLKRSNLADQVEVVTDGEAALAYLRNKVEAQEDVPEIVFLDVNMPRMNGFEFLQEYSELPAEAKSAQDVFLLSTSLLREDHTRAEDHPDIREFITKPVSKEKLHAIFVQYHARRAD